MRFHPGNAALDLLDEIPAHRAFRLVLKMPLSAAACRRFRLWFAAVHAAAGVVGFHRATTLTISIVPSSAIRPIEIHHAAE